MVWQQAQPAIREGGWLLALASRIRHRPRHEGGTGAQSNRPGRPLRIGHFSNVESVLLPRNTLGTRRELSQPGR